MKKESSPFIEAFFMASDIPMGDYILGRITLKEAIDKASLNFEKIVNSSNFESKIIKYYNSFVLYSDIEK